MENPAAQHPRRGSPSGLGVGTSAITGAAGFSSSCSHSTIFLAYRSTIRHPWGLRAALRQHLRRRDVMTWVSPPVGRVTPPQFLQLLAHETGGNSESPARHRSDHAPRGSFLSCRITAATAAATRTATNTSRVRLIRRPPSAAPKGKPRH